MKLRLLFILTLSVIAFSTIGAQTPPVVPQDAKGYRLGPGDEILGKVLGEPEFDFVVTVNEDGNIELPFSDAPLAAKCKTERQLRNDITTLLTRQLRGPQLSLRTVSKSRPPATVYGEVRTPVKVDLFRKATLVELIAAAGGVSDEAGGLIQVFRTQAPMCEDSADDAWKTDGTDATAMPFRVYSLTSLREGKAEANPAIYPGDVILVQKAAPVYVTGEVVAQQGIYLKESGLTLSEAIAMVGGVKREAKTKDIKIYRLKPNSKERETIAVNYDLVKKRQQTDPLLEPYDIVEVDKAKESILTSIAKLAMGAGKTVISSGSSGLGYKILY